ncbi:MAG: SGNH/GDSL hydrolase family protein [Planctomycetaceae bacterium]
MPPNPRHVLSSFMAIIGAIMVLVAVFAKQTGLSHSVASWPALLMLLFGTTLITVGLLRRRSLKVYTTLAILSANTAVLFLSIEFGALVLNRIMGTHVLYHGNPDTSVDEFLQISSKQSIYVGWRGQPFQGNKININQDGLRLTPPVVDSQAVPIRVFTFGGSTMWGEGAADDETIASFLQALLTEQCGHVVQVTNFGQRGWVSTQGLIELLLQLEHGNVPDAVVFYDGYNEVTAAYSTGEIGIPENFQGMTTYGNAAKIALRNIARQSEMGRMFSSVTQRPVTRIDVGPVSQAVVDTYLSVLRITRSLGKEYGFDVLFYWQPQLYTDRKILTTEEAALLDHPWLPEPVKALTTAVYELARRAADADSQLTDISDCFAGQTERIYLDPCHIVGAGNRLVAEAMLRHHLLEVIQNRLSLKR